MRVRVSVSFGGRRLHRQVCWAGDGWAVALAIPTPHGYRFEYPDPRRFKTKKEALEWKRKQSQEPTP